MMIIGQVNKKGKWHLLSQNKQSKCTSARNKEWEEIKEVDFIPQNLCVSCWECLIDEAIIHDTERGL